jgi:hypothetical protein
MSRSVGVAEGVDLVKVKVAKADREQDDRIAVGCCGFGSVSTNVSRACTAAQI